MPTNVCTEDVGGSSSDDEEEASDTSSVSSAASSAASSISSGPRGGGGGGGRDKGRDKDGNRNRKARLDKMLKVVKGAKVEEGGGKGKDCVVS